MGNSLRVYPTVIIQYHRRGTLGLTLTPPSSGFIVSRVFFFNESALPSLKIVVTAHPSPILLLGQRTRDRIPCRKQSQASRPHGEASTLASHSPPSWDYDSVYLSSPGGFWAGFPFSKAQLTGVHTPKLSSQSTKPLYKTYKLTSKSLRPSGQVSKIWGQNLTLMDRKHLRCFQG